jgi:rifampin ADP-ribosylating transferase
VLAYLSNVANKIQLNCVMLYDPANPVVQLCAQGIEMEHTGDPVRAADLYRQAWEKSGAPLEKCTAAHYLARVQPAPAESLRWNLLALEQVELVTGEDIGVLYPSLQLNVAHGYEQMGDLVKALEHYALAKRACVSLAEDGYGKMIRGGIEAGLERLRKPGA